MNVISGLRHAEEILRKPYRETEEVLALTRRVLNESGWLCNRVGPLVEQQQKTNTTRLAWAAQSVRRVQEVVRERIDDVNREIQLLQKNELRLTNGWQLVSRVMRLNEDCLQLRKRRPSTDLVEDEVNRQLLIEKKNGEKFHNLIGQLLQQTTDQIQRNRERKRGLENEWSDKMEHHVSELTVAEIGQRSSPHPRGVSQTGSLVPRKTYHANRNEWQEETETNLIEVEHELELCRQVRSTSDILLDTMAKEMQSGGDRVAAALAFKINAMETHRIQLQRCRSQVSEDIARVEGAGKELQRVKSRLAPPLSVARFRFQNRVTSRPPRETFDDNIQHRLINEVESLRDTVEQVESKMANAENVLQRLLSVANQLDTCISTQTKGLRVDKDKCQRLRQENFPKDFNPRFITALWGPV